MIYKKDIATEYLNAAMQMYLRKENYFCAIHLAAAAFELFDLHLPKNRNCSPPPAWLASIRGEH